MGLECIEGPDGVALSIRMALPADVADVMAAHGLRREDHFAREWEVACGRMGARIEKGHDGYLPHPRRGWGAGRYAGEFEGMAAC